MKRIISAVLTVLMLFSLAACGAEEEEQTVIEALPQGEDVEVVGSEPEQEESAGPDDAVTAVYYHGDEQAEKLVREAAELRAGYEAQDVIDLLVSKGVLPEGIIVNAWGCDENKIMNIDFNSAFSEALQGMGTAGEYIILGSTVNSLIDNFELSGVMISVDGETLATGHNIYDYVQTFYE